MVPRQLGPLEQIWRDCGLPVIPLPRLHQPRLVFSNDGAACAFLPAEASGPEREILFGWLIVELARHRGHCPPLVNRLASREGDRR